jgi:elongation factor Ts
MDSFIDKIKYIRTVSSASILSCKSALKDSKGDLDLALKVLKEKGILEASKKIHKKTETGIIILRTIKDNSFIFKLRCQTVFASQSIHIQTLGNEIASFLNSLEYVKNTYYKNVHTMNLKAQDFNIINRLIREAIFILKENVLFNEIYIIKNKTHGAYIHHNNLSAGLVSLKMNITDKSNKSHSVETNALAKDLAMHAVAYSPLFINHKAVDSSCRLAQKDVILKQKNDVLKGKPTGLKDEIVKNCLKKNIVKNCFLNQDFIKDPSISVQNEIEKYEKIMRIKIKVENFIIVKINNK